MFNVPPLVLGLIVANGVVFAALHLLPENLAAQLFLRLAFIPEMFRLPGMFLNGVSGLFTHMFVHESLIHLLVNMGGLLAFGTPVELRLGKPGFLILYVMSGIVGITLDAGFSSGTAVYIGASGAVTGAFGAVLFMMNRAGLLSGGAPRMQGLVTVVLVVAAVNVITGMIGMPGINASIAWLAHIGGLVTGLILFPLLDKKRLG